MRLIIIWVIVGLGSGCVPVNGETIVGSVPLKNMRTYGWLGEEVHYVGRQKSCSMFTTSRFSEPGVIFFRPRPTIYLYNDRRAALHNSIIFDVAHAQHPKSSPVVIIDSRKFGLVSRGKNALSPDKKTEKEIVNAMKSGAKAVVRSVTEDGTRVEDHFDLRGFAEMLDEVNKACPLDLSAGS